MVNLLLETGDFGAPGCLDIVQLLPGFLQTVLHCFALCGGEGESEVVECGVRCVNGIGNRLGWGNGSGNVYVLWCGNGLRNVCGREREWVRE